MDRMTERDRQTWLTRTGKAHRDLSDKACQGDFRCDRCDAPSASVSHGGGAPVTVLCSSCYKAVLHAESAALRAFRYDR